MITTVVVSVLVLVFAGTIFNMNPGTKLTLAEAFALGSAAERRDNFSVGDGLATVTVYERGLKMRRLAGLISLCLWGIIGFFTLAVF